jgi:signal transduction histidine kinase
MKRSALIRHLGWIFILAVVVPGILLAVIAVRSIKREEAYIEKQLQGTLLAEVTYLVSLVDAELSGIEKELAGSAPDSASGDPQDLLEEWRLACPLVGSPFLLSARFEILWPRLEGSLSEEQRSFLRLNSEFLSNRLKVPVFENIALAYQDQVVSGKSDKGEEKVKGAELQRVISSFEMSRDVQEKVYRQAREEGQNPEPRTVVPSANLPGRQEQPPPSIFVSTELRLADITAESDLGLVPRFFEDQLALLFWKKLNDGSILGCLLADEVLKERLVALLPEVYTPVRILTLLDERGGPLIAPQEQTLRDYRRPFVARELSALLPRWEAAAYLTDPQIVSSRAGRVVTILWVLISILFVSILAGGTLVLKTVRAEVSLARQKTLFVANVSHELKTPLTSIRMFAEMLRGGRQGSAKKSREYLTLMVEEAHRLTRLINNVLDFSAMERGEKRYDPQVLDAAELCRELVASQGPRYKQSGFSLKLRCSFPAEEAAGGAERAPDKKPAAGLPVRADREALRQALMNLLSNAEKYSAGGKVVEVALQPSGPWLAIDIMDRGRGIAPSEAKHIFKEFYRGDESVTAGVRGSGLGLAISRRILRDQGGDIEYMPREGGGSIFRVRLPLVEEP